MSPVRSLKRITPRVYIPPQYGALSKIEITRSDSNTDDITDLIYSGEIIDGVTDTIGSFEFTIDNSNESFTGVWTGGETLRLYMDYATSATTTRFRGIIEKVSYRDYKIKITGRSVSSKLLGIAVTQSFTNIEPSVILKEIFDTYATDFTYTNVDATSTTVTVNWYEKSFWECVQELCHASGFDAYIDVDLDCNFFESGSRDNTNEAVIHESNLFEVGDFAYDHSLLKNKVIVYGADIGGIPLFKTAEDETSQETYGVKELIINDSNITTEAQCQERADYELSLAKDPPLVGEVTSTGLATIQPGERIYISAPLSNLNPSYYKIISHKQKFEGYMRTILTIEKEPKKIYHIMRDRISQERKLSEMPNPNKMGYSKIYAFKEDSGTHSNTIIDTDLGILKTDGVSSGTWVSEIETLSKPVAGVEIRIRGSNLSGVKVFLTLDGGVTYTQSLLSLGSTITIPGGENMGIRVVLPITTQVNTVGVLYKF